METSSPHCPHFETGFEADPPLDVCTSCVEIGSTWHHLRQCLNCGRSSCCDNSPNRHATAHFHEAGHPMMRSAQPGEDWRWCFPDELIYIPDGAGGYEIAED